MRKLLLPSLLLFISTSIIFISCKKNEAEVQNPVSQNEKIVKAKAWFESKLPTMNLYSLYKTAKYDWTKAGTFKFKNGYEIITVPLVNENVSKKSNSQSKTNSKTTSDSSVGFIGKEKLLIYPRLDGKGYFTKVLQVLPTLNYLIAYNNKFDPKNFTGYVSVWSLETGFKKV